MNGTSKIISVLTVVCVVCAFFLSLVYGKAEKRIEDNAKKRVENAIVTLAPLADRIEEMPVDEGKLYKLFDKNSDFFGYAFSAEGQGYQGKIKIIAVSDKRFNALGVIDIVESSETPGLGAKIQESSFKDQFKTLDVLNSIEYTKDVPDEDNQIRAITGATVSSKAVVNILNQRIKILRDTVVDSKQQVQVQEQE